MSVTEVEVHRDLQLLGDRRSTGRVVGLVTVEDVVNSYGGISEEYLVHKTRELHPGLFEQFAWLHLTNGHLDRGGTGLDAGGGTGWLARILAKAYPESMIVNLDASEPMISLSKRSNADLPNLIHRTAFMNATNFDDGAVDFIGSSRALDCVPPEMVLETFSEFRRILTDDGILIVAVCDEERNRLYAETSGVRYIEGAAYREHWPGADSGDGVLRFYNTNSFYIEEAKKAGFKLRTAYNPRPPEDMRHNRNTLDLFNRYSQRTSSFIMQFEKER